jgi:hypothetical protein
MILILAEIISDCGLKHFGAKKEFILTEVTLNPQNSKK